MREPKDIKCNSTTFPTRWKVLPVARKVPTGNTALHSCRVAAEKG